MALQPPILPQLQNGIITTTQIADSNGVIVEVPLYQNVSVGDAIRIYWNNAIVETYVVTQITDLPRLFLVPGSFTVIGSNSVYYTSTDTAGNLSLSPIIALNVTQGTVVPGYTLTATIITNNAQANTLPGNTILYTLSSTGGGSIANQFLIFDTLGGTPSASFGQTNSAGVYVLNVSSNVPGDVLVNAFATVAPAQVVHTVLSFSQAAISYQLASEILSNGAPANGTAQNTVRVRLTNAATGQGVPGQLLNVSVNGAASYPSIVSTNNDGYAYISLSSLTIGTVIVTVSLQSNPSVNTTATVNFILSYPILLGNHTAYLYNNIGLQTFLGPYNIVVNHHYHIVVSRPYYQVKNCTGIYAFTISTGSCKLGYARNYTFLDRDLSDVIAIATGPGANLTSERYQYYPTNYAGVAEILVYDYGPYYNAFGTNSAIAQGPDQTDEPLLLDEPEETAAEEEEAIDPIEDDKSER